MDRVSSGGRVGRLRGDVRKGIAARAAVGGWHPVEWGCEFVGTALQLGAAFWLVVALESPLSPLNSAIPWPTVRLILIGLGIGALAWLVALSPLGRRSGAHLNPAVTVGFWARGVTHVHDLVGFVLAQFAGATLGALVFVLTAGSWAQTAGYARTEPAVGPWTALGVEVAISFVLVLAILLFASSKRTHRWTPAVATLALAVLIPLGGPPTGASMNPARTFGPDLVSGNFPALWVYLLGPIAGALLAAAAFPLLARGRRVLTGKLHHDPRYRSVHADAFRSP